MNSAAYRRGLPSAQSAGGTGCAVGATGTTGPTTGVTNGSGGAVFSSGCSAGSGSGCSAPTAGVVAFDSSSVGGLSLSQRRKYTYIQGFFSRLYNIFEIILKKKNGLINVTAFSYEIKEFSSNGCREDTPLRQMSSKNLHSAVIETNKDNEPDAVALL